MPRRSFFARALALAATAALPAQYARAQLGAQPIRLIFPFAPGGC